MIYLQKKLALTVPLVNCDNCNINTQKSVAQGVTLLLSVDCEQFLFFFHISEGSAHAREPCFVRQTKKTETSHSLFCQC